MKAIRKNIALPVSGTFNIPVEPTVVGQQIYSHWIVTGTETLINDFDIQPIGTELRYTSIDILWNANLDLDGNTVNIFGKDVPTTLIEAGLFLTNCFYNGTAWVVTFFISTEDGVIDTDMIKDLAITEAKVADNSVTLAKMYELATGSVIFGNASNRPTALSVADSTIVIGDSSTGLVSVAVSGEATLAKSGALTIATSAVTTAKIADGSVTTAKIADDAVTAAKLDDDSNRTQVVIPTSFESAGEIGVLEYKICFPCTLEAIHATVTKPFTSTGTHIFKDDTGTVLTGSQIDMSNALTLGNIVSTTPTANNTFVAGDVIKIETSVSGAVGGRSTIVLCMLKS